MLVSISPISATGQLKVLHSQQAEVVSWSHWLLMAGIASGRWWDIWRLMGGERLLLFCKEKWHKAFPVVCQMAGWFGIFGVKWLFSLAFKLFSHDFSIDSRDCKKEKSMKKEASNLSCGEPLEVFLFSNYIYFLLIVVLDNLGSCIS